MAIKIVLLIMTTFFISWGLCRSKHTEKPKVRKTDFWFLMSSLIMCIVMTALGMLMHIRINLWFLLIPTISMSLMCLYTKQAMKYESCNSFTIFEKGLLVLLVVFLCSGVVDCSIYEYGIRRLTHFYMASMFYKMLGGWILAELVLCRRFPLALIKYFFLIVLVVNVVRFIGFSYRPFYTYQDGIYYLIQIAITFVVLPYMYCRCHYAHKDRNK